MADLSPYIGSVLGIKVQLHWTFVVLMLLTLLFAAVFNLLYLFILIVLLFVCVFVHELFHSITAKRNNVVIKKIILLPLGGASVMDETKRVDPDTEFRIAAVGPLSSIVLGIAFGIIAVLIQPGLLRQITQFLFEINVLLGVFNILPGFPLDGGRMLRSYLQRRNSLVEATRKAVKASNVFLAVFIIGTILYAALVPNYNFASRELIVFWDLIIAMFLYDGAKAELQNTYVKHYAEGVPLRVALSRNYMVVDANTRIEHLYKKLLKAHTHIIIARDGRQFRAVNRIPTQQEFEKHKYSTVRDISIPVRTIQYGKSLYDAVSLMSSENVGILVVVKGERLKGVLLAQHVEYMITLRARALRHSGKG